MDAPIGKSKREDLQFVIGQSEIFASLTQTENGPKGDLGTQERRTLVLMGGLGQKIRPEGKYRHYMTKKKNSNAKETGRGGGGGVISVHSELGSSGLGRGPRGGMRRVLVGNISMLTGISDLLELPDFGERQIR